MTISLSAETRVAMAWHRPAVTLTASWPTGALRISTVRPGAVPERGLSMVTRQVPWYCLRGPVDGAVAVQGHSLAGALAAFPGGEAAGGVGADLDGGAAGEQGGVELAQLVVVGGADAGDGVAGPALFDGDAAEPLGAGAVPADPALPGADHFGGDDALGGRARARGGGRR
nr:hypothetical protein GCM10010200_065800 [Actinomadura rugatobispora]